MSCDRVRVMCPFIITNDCGFFSSSPLPALFLFVFSVMYRCWAITNCRTVYFRARKKHNEYGITNDGERENNSKRTNVCVYRALYVLGLESCANLHNVFQTILESEKKREMKKDVKNYNTHRHTYMCACWAESSYSYSRVFFPFGFHDFLLESFQLHTIESVWLEHFHRTKCERNKDMDSNR